jgi:hypothetical protein
MAFKNNLQMRCVIIRCLAAKGDSSVTMAGTVVEMLPVWLACGNSNGRFMQRLQYSKGTRVQPWCKCTCIKHRAHAVQWRSALAMQIAKHGHLVQQLSAELPLYAPHV